MIRFFLPILCVVMLGGMTGCNPILPLKVFPSLTPASIPPGATRTPPVDHPSSPAIQTSVAASPSPSPRATPDTGKDPTGTLTPTRVCNLAAAGRPIDVTIPDDTRVGPGDSFVKTWRLVNMGSCTWTRGYAAVWFSGMAMGGQREESLRRSVSPQESVDISVEMSAPLLTGEYQSNWKLRDEAGNFFGIGPAGNSPFWVRIEVVE